MFLVVVCHLSNDIQPDVVKTQNWLSYGNLHVNLGWYAFMHLWH